MKKQPTSWGNVSNWYNDLLKKENTYQNEVILPNLLRLIKIKKTDIVLDLACGQGFFSHEYAKFGEKIIGVDVSEELIKLAKKGSVANENFFVSPAANLFFLQSKIIDKISIVLALQNIDNFDAVIKECSRVLKDNGKLFIVLNHPAFRIPKKSDWGYDAKNKVQYRRIEKYMSEININIDMNPGEKVQKFKQYTKSFHIPLQSYFRAFNNNNFVVKNLEEWISNKKSQNGPRQKIEDIARKEIPMFMCLEVIKI